MHVVWHMEPMVMLVLWVHVMHEVHVLMVRVVRVVGMGMGVHVADRWHAGTCVHGRPSPTTTTMAMMMVVVVLLLMLMLMLVLVWARAPGTAAWVGIVVTRNAPVLVAWTTKMAAAVEALAVGAGIFMTHNSDSKPLRTALLWCGQSLTCSRINLDKVHASKPWAPNQHVVCRVSCCRCHESRPPASSTHAVNTGAASTNAKVAVCRHIAQLHSPFTPQLNHKLRVGWLLLLLAAVICWWRGRHKHNLATLWACCNQAPVLACQGHNSAVAVSCCQLPIGQSSDSRGRQARSHSGGRGDG